MTTNREIIFFLSVMLLFFIGTASAVLHYTSAVEVSGLAFLMLIAVRRP